jgi:hypothetical protein
LTYAGIEITDTDSLMAVADLIEDADVRIECPECLGARSITDYSPGLGYIDIQCPCCEGWGTIPDYDADYFDPEPPTPAAPAPAVVGRLATTSWLFRNPGESTSRPTTGWGSGWASSPPLDGFTNFDTAGEFKVALGRGRDGVPGPLNERAGGCEPALPGAPRSHRQEFASGIKDAGEPTCLTHVCSQCWQSEASRVLSVRLR